MAAPFHKMHGLGNDFAVFDRRGEGTLTPDQAIHVMSAYGDPGTAHRAHTSTKTGMPGRNRRECGEGK